MGLHRIILIVSVFFLFAMGLVMIFSTTSAEVLDHDLERSTHQALFKQIVFAILGMALVFSIWKFGYQTILNLSPQILFVFCILLLLTLIPGIGREVNGSRRWLQIAGVSFQPSEFVKYLLPAFVIHKYFVCQNSPVTMFNMAKLAVQIVFPIFLILIEPNNGTAAVIGLSLVVLFFLLGINFKYWALPLLILVAIGGISAYHLPYVSNRIKVYLNPELDLKGKGHQPYQAKIAAGSGELFGKGPGNSLQKLSYLPEAQNDYIAAIYAEEFGFAGISVLIFFYMTIGYCGFYLLSHTTEIKGFYWGSIIVFLICFQAFLNLGVVSGLVPSTGLNLPLFSQGGTSLMANIFGIGMLLNISKQTSNINTQPSKGFSSGTYREEYR